MQPASSEMLTLLQNFGAPMVVMISLGWAAWRVTTWLGQEIIIPLRNVISTRVVTFIDRMESMIEKIELSLDAIETAIGRLEEKQHSMIEGILKESELRRHTIMEWEKKIQSGEKK